MEINETNDQSYCRAINDNQITDISVCSCTVTRKHGETLLQTATEDLTNEMRRNKMFVFSSLLQMYEVNPVLTRSKADCISVQCTFTSVEHGAKFAVHTFYTHH